MAFDSKNFSVMAYANGFTLWNYNTSDALTAVEGTGYFNDIAPFSRKGDMILLAASTSSTIEPAVLAVTDISSGVVTVSNFAKAAKSE